MAIGFKLQMTRIVLLIALFFCATVSGTEGLFISMKYYRSSTGEHRYIFVDNNRVLFADIDVGDFESSDGRSPSQSMLQYAELTKSDFESYRQKLSGLGIFNWKGNYLPDWVQELEDQGKPSGMRCHQSWDYFVSRGDVSSTPHGSCATPENHAEFIESTKLAAFTQTATESLPANKIGNFLLTFEYKKNDNERLFFIVKGTQLVFVRHASSGSQQDGNTKPSVAPEMHYKELTRQELNGYLEKLMALGFWKLKHRYMGKAVMQQLEAGISPWKECHDRWDMWLMYKGSGGYHYGICAAPENFHEFLRITEKLANTQLH